MLDFFRLPQVPLKYLLALYTVLLGLYSIFSYSQTDPNLVLTTWAPYWQFQQWMWQTFFTNHSLTTWLYIGLLSLLFIIYGWIVQVLERSSSEYEVGWKKYFLCYGLLIAPLMLSYNALSHDVFNYIFNAKMVLVYHANPHVQVALDFATDPWTRFMHNTHTAAPYWYGWTGLSLIPFLLGMGKFVLTWLSFRLWSVLSIVLLYWTLQYAARIFTGHTLQAYQLALVFCNPLFIIEIVSNMHNDLWMVVPAVLALALVTSLDSRHTPQAKKLGLAVLFLAVSISIKLATATLIPLILIIIVEKNFLFALAEQIAQRLPVFKKLPAQILQTIESQAYRYVPALAAASLFIPLLTPRSQLFHPWYWVWVLVWVPFISNKVVRTCVLLFSVSSMARYIPWLWAGSFEGNVLIYQQLVTWVPVFVYLLWKFFPTAIISAHAQNSELRRVE